MIELDNTKLEQLIKEKQPQEKILEELEKTTIIVPINTPTEEGIKDPLGFDLEQIGHEYTADIPAYTNYDLLPSDNSLELNIIDLARLLWDADGKYRNIVINPNTDSYTIPINDILDYFYEILYSEEILRLEEKEKNEIVEGLEYTLELLKEESATLQEDYYLYLREDEDGMMNLCPEDTFISFIPLYVSTNPDYNKELPYFNVLSMKKGNKILYLQDLEEELEFNVIIAPGTRFDLVEELEDGTKVWECVEQMFYKDDEKIVENNKIKN